MSSDWFVVAAFVLALPILPVVYWSLGERYKSLYLTNRRTFVLAVTVVVVGIAGAMVVAVMLNSGR